jgi:hypothetical protein
MLEVVEEELRTGSGALELGRDGGWEHSMLTLSLILRYSKKVLPLFVDGPIYRCADIRVKI